MDDPIRHAKSYPFPILDHSYVYDNGTIEPFDVVAPSNDGRLPVLAAGSNQSHEQIDRKYGRLEGDVVIPAQRVYLRDFDVVFAAHISSYGSVPATFQRAPGTTVTAFVLWLNEPQLERMHETEGNYTFDRLDNIQLAVDDTADVITSAYAYSSRIGCLNVDGGCISLADIEARERQFDAWSQPEVLAHLRDNDAPGQPLDDFIRAHLEDDELRRERSRRLGMTALPLTYRRQIIETF